MKSAIRYETKLEVIYPTDNVKLYNAFALLKEDEYKIRQMLSNKDTYKLTNNVQTTDVMGCSEIIVVFNSIEAMLTVADIVGAHVFTDIRTHLEILEQTKREYIAGSI